MNKRIGYIDEFRGIAVIIMVFFHFIYQENLLTGDMGDLLSDFYINLLKTVAQIIFIALAGVCCNYSRNNIKRGLVYIYIGLFIDLFTYLVIPEEIIIFGIFSFMGLSVLIYELFKKELNNMSINRGIVLFIFTFIITYCLQQKMNDLELRNNEILNTLIDGGYLNFIGIKSSSFRSSDFFPIFPWIFIFMAGVLLGRKSYKLEGSNKIKLRLLAFIGRKSLLIYFIHSPILIIIIKVIS